MNVYSPKGAAYFLWLSQDSRDKYISKLVQIHFILQVAIASPHGQVKRLAMGCSVIDGPSIALI